MSVVCSASITWPPTSDQGSTVIGPLLVVGSPNGRLGFILNRGAFPPDRLKAARDVLEWNGYDLRRLVVY